MPRVSNWPHVLTAFIAERSATPFAWGSNDCCLFVADWLTALTGSEPPQATALRGTYSDAAGAVAAVGALGGVEQLAADYCESQAWEEVRPSFAQRGDIVVYDGAHGPSLGVCVGSRIAGPDPEGLDYIPIRGARRAWRVK